MRLVFLRIRPRKLGVCAKFLSCFVLFLFQRNMHLLLTLPWLRTDFVPYSVGSKKGVGKTDDDGSREKVGKKTEMTVL